MSDKRCAVMFLRLGFLASVFCALFWSAWHISGQQVPSYTSLNITNNFFWTFSVSHWWDIPFAFLLVNIYAWILRVYYKITSQFVKKEDLYSVISVNVALGLVGGFAGILAGGPITAIIVSLIVITIAFFIVHLSIIIVMLFSFDFWKPIYNWFAAKNIS